MNVFVSVDLKRRLAQHPEKAASVPWRDGRVGSRGRIRANRCTGKMGRLIPQFHLLEDVFLRHYATLIKCGDE